MDARTSTHSERRAMHSHFSSRKESVNILTMKVERVDEATCIREILSCIARRQGGWIITSNVDILRRYTRDPGFRRLADGASFMVADGMPLIWASILQGVSLPERIAGANLVSS